MSPEELDKVIARLPLMALNQPEERQDMISSLKSHVSASGLATSKAGQQQPQVTTQSTAKGDVSESDLRRAKIAQTILFALQHQEAMFKAVRALILNGAAADVTRPRPIQAAVTNTQERSVQANADVSQAPLVQPASTGPPTGPTQCSAANEKDVPVRSTATDAQASSTQPEATKVQSEVAPSPAVNARKKPVEPAAISKNATTQTGTHEAQAPPASDQCGASHFGGVALQGRTSQSTATRVNSTQPKAANARGRNSTVGSTNKKRAAEEPSENCIAANTKKMKTCTNRSANPHPIDNLNTRYGPTVIGSDLNSARLASPAETLMSSEHGYRSTVMEPEEEVSDRLSQLCDDVRGLQADIETDAQEREEDGLDPIDYGLERLKLERSLHELYISLDRLAQVSYDKVDRALDLLQWVEHELDDDFYEDGFWVTLSREAYPPPLCLQSSIKCFKREIATLGNCSSECMLELRKILYVFHMQVDLLELVPTEADYVLDNEGIRH